MGEKLGKIEIYAPFKQREYIKLLKETVRELEEGPAKEKILHMCDVLIKDDYSAMTRELPEKYYEIIGGYSGLVIGKCAEPDDVFCEEPQALVREITKEEFDED